MDRDHGGYRRGHRLLCPRRRPPLSAHLPHRPLLPQAQKVSWSGVGLYLLRQAVVCWLLVAECPSNMLVYLRDGSARTSCCLLVA